MVTRVFAKSVADKYEKDSYQGSGFSPAAKFCENDLRAIGRNCLYCVRLCGSGAFGAKI